MNLLDRLLTHAGTAHVNESEAAAEIERLTTELASVRADYQKYVDGNDHAMDGEVKRLQAIVGKLSKTKDGVPVVPGMTLYSPNGIGEPISTCNAPAAFAYVIWYSTPEAAEAAKGTQ